MIEFQRFFGDEFFVIDSNDLDNVKEKFYGYMLTKDGIIENHNISDNIELTGIGSYLWVRNSEDEIRIIQDYGGTYPIFMYFADDKSYFAMSNSYVKLLEYLKSRGSLSLNEDYANSFMFIDLSSSFYGETLINEIKVIPKNLNVVIDKQNRDVRYDRVEIQDASLSLDTQEGIDALDKWFERWVSIIRVIRKKTNNIRFDLSGGFDSRAVSVLWLSANINPETTFINSIKNENKLKFQQDLAIASEITKDQGFEVNINKFKEKRIFFENINTAVLLSFYTKLGLHKEMYNSKFKYENPVFIMGGLGGGTVRGYAYKTSKQFISEKVRNLSGRGKEVCDSTDRIFNASFSKLLEDLPDVDADSKDLPRLLYNEVRLRYHFGRKMCEDYNRNIYNLTPLMDPILHKIKLSTDECDDRDLLFTLIYARYCPKLLEYPFEGDRSITEETIAYAKKINERFPYSKKHYDYIEAPDPQPERKKTKRPKRKRKKKKGIKTYIMEVFNTEMFKNEFEKYLPSKYYEMIYDGINKGKVRKIAEVYSAMAVLYSINCIHDNYADLNSWINSFLKSPFIDDCEITVFEDEIIKKYETARIDIVKKSETLTGIEILESDDEYCVVRNLQTQDGNGLLSIDSRKSKLNLKVKCRGFGKLQIGLKSVDVIGREGKSFPIFIDYEKFAVDGKDYLTQNMLLSHDNPQYIELDVEDSQIIKFNMEWMPFEKANSS